MIQQILLSITFVYAPLFLLTRTKIFNKHLCLPFESLSLTNNKTVLGNITLLLDIINFLQDLNV